MYRDRRLFALGGLVITLTAAVTVLSACCCPVTSLSSLGQRKATPQPDYLRVPGQSVATPRGNREPDIQVAKDVLDAYHTAVQNHQWDTAIVYRAQYDFESTQCLDIFSNYGPGTADQLQSGYSEQVQERGELVSWEYQSVQWSYQAKQGGGYYEASYSMFRYWGSGYKERVAGTLAPNKTGQYKICYLKEYPY